MLHTHHIPHIRNTDIPPSTTNFAFRVQPPDFLNFLYNIIATDITNYIGSLAKTRDRSEKAYEGVNEVFIPSSKDDHVCWQFGTILKLQTSFSNFGNSTIILEFNLLVDDELRSTGICEVIFHYQKHSLGPKSFTAHRGSSHRL